MSRIASKRTVKLDLGDGEWVEISENLPYKDIEAVALAVEGSDTKARLDQVTKLFEVAIRGWNILDENGISVPYSVEKIKELDFKTIKEIQDFIVKQYELGDGSKKN